MYIVSIFGMKPFGVILDNLLLLKGAVIFIIQVNLTYTGMAIGLS